MKLYKKNTEFVQDKQVIFLVPKLESLGEENHTQIISLHILALDSPNHHPGSVLGNALGGKALLCRVVKRETQLGSEKDMASAVGRYAASRRRGVSSPQPRSIRF